MRKSSPIFVSACLLICGGAVAAQEQFEVASIKPTTPGGMHLTGARVYPGGRVELSALPLVSLVAIAFRVAYWQITVPEKWMEQDRFDIEAKPPENVVKNLRYTNYGLEDEHLRAMVQHLLIERFQLKTHGDTKPGDVYRLELSGKALRLQASQAPEGASFGSIGFARGRWVLDNTMMAQLAKYAGDNILHTAVIDATGLNGPFDYKQPVSLPDSEANYSDPSDSFIRLMGEVGLKLVRGKGTIELLVIESASRPSAN